MIEPFKFSPADGTAAFPADPAAMRFAYVLKHGTMKLGLYGVSGEDRQQPHAQDELYVVVSGAADFVKDGERVRCGPSDVLFVEAGKAHRFEAMTPDFSTWVMFWGPDGGEG
ncbi:cupin domain-containing protein [Phenylobacterium sp.]|uniref:cupin domain-containing protein n=1 Tax=Phenylobacterium sp. TaxID=1871053 RepID=UPI00356A1129